MPVLLPSTVDAGRHVTACLARHVCRLEKLAAQGAGLDAARQREKQRWAAACDRAAAYQLEAQELRHAAYRCA